MSWSGHYKYVPPVATYTLVEGEDTVVSSALLWPEALAAVQAANASRPGEFRLHPDACGRLEPAPGREPALAA